MTEDKQEKRPEISIDLGLGGLFRGLSDLIDSLGTVLETGEEVKRTGEFRVKGLGEKGRGVYGFSIRTGAGGMPHVERFGNIRATEEGPEVAEVREPLVDLFDEEDEIVVVIELPGVGEEEIQVEIHDDVLGVETTGQRKYAKEILLPGAVQAEGLRQVYRNGILELRLNKIPPRAV
jgi:HSP20 family protein